MSLNTFSVFLDSALLHLIILSLLLLSCHQIFVLFTDTGLATKVQLRIFRWYLGGFIFLLSGLHSLQRYLSGLVPCPWTWLVHSCISCIPNATIALGSFTSNSTSTQPSTQPQLNLNLTRVGVRVGVQCLNAFYCHDISVMNQIAKTIQKVPDAPKYSGTLQTLLNIF